MLKTLLILDRKLQTLRLSQGCLTPFDSQETCPYLQVSYAIHEAAASAAQPADGAAEAEPAGTESADRPNKRIKTAGEHSILPQVLLAK